MPSGRASSMTTFALGHTLLKQSVKPRFSNSSTHTP